MEINNTYMSIGITIVFSILSTICLVKLCNKYFIKNNRENMGINLAICMIVTGTVFGRLYYYIFDSTDAGANFFKPNMQFGSFGVFAGFIIAAFIISKLYNVNFLKIMDVMSVPAVILLIGQRISDYCLGNNFGRTVSEGFFQKFPFSVYMKVGNGGVYIVAVFTYEFIYLLILLSVLINLLKKNNKKLKEKEGCNGAIISFGLVFYCLGRVVFESMRQDSLYVGFVKIAQVISIITALAIMGIYIVKAYKYKKINIMKTVGIIFAILIAVAIGFYCEFFMGTEVEKLYTAILAVCMLILLFIYIYLYLTVKKINKVVDK